MQREFPEATEVKVGGVIYDVKQAEVIERDSNMLGGFDLEEATITLKRPLAFYQKRLGFMHELVHAMDAGAGLDLNEQTTHALANQLTQVLADNFILFDKLFGPLAGMTWKPEAHLTEFVPLKDEAPKVTNVKGTFVAERPGTAVPGGANG